MSLTIGIPHLTAVNCDDLLAAGSGKGAEVAERMGEAGGGGDRGKRRPGKSGSA